MYKFVSKPISITRNDQTSSAPSGVQRRGMPCFEHWLEQALMQYASRRAVAARTELFSRGDQAKAYFLVVSGELLVCSRRVGTRTVIRLLQAGDLFIHECDGVHAAECSAVRDSSVLRIDRRRFDSLCRIDPWLRDIRTALHSTELEFLLAGPGPIDGATGISGTIRAWQSPATGVAAIRSVVLQRGRDAPLASGGRAPSLTIDAPSRSSAEVPPSPLHVRPLRRDLAGSGTRAASCHP